MKESLSTFMKLAAVAVIIAALIYGKLMGVMDDTVDKVVNYMSNL